MVTFALLGRRNRHSILTIFTVIAMVMAVMAGAPPAEASPTGTTLYAVSGANGSTATLYELDAATGAVLDTIGAIGFDGVSSIDVHPFSGVAYAVANNAPGGETLITIDLDTGLGTAVGLTTNGGPIPDITFNSSGTLYGWGESGDDLYTINTSTGLATLVGEAGISTRGTGLAFDPGGTLWLKVWDFGGSNTLLYTVDPGTGVATLDGTITGTALHNVLAFDEAGVAYSIFREGSAPGGGPGTESVLHTIDTSVPSLSVVGDIGVIGISGLTFANTAPVAMGETATVQTGGSVWIDVLANDTDADDDFIIIDSIAVAPSHGTAIPADSGVLYTHDGSGAIADSFAYQIRDGVGGIAQAIVTIAVTTCDAGGDLVNGSFETGNFEGWCSVDLNDPFWPQGVRKAGSEPWTGLFVGEPTDGTWAVSNGFDGDGPGTIELYQIVSLPVATMSAVLTFDWRAGWDMDTFCGGCTGSRTFDVVVSTPDGVTELDVINVVTADPTTVNPDTGPQSEMVDMTAFGGQTFRITFRSTIPENLTGPAHLQIDDVALDFDLDDPISAVVLGGTGAVSDAVAADLAGLTDNMVTRLAGSDRYSTAAEISAATFSPGVPVVFIAVGDNFPDALAGGPPAAIEGGPILLTAKDLLPGATKAELARLDPGRIVVLGGTGVVSDAVMAELGAYTAGAVTRLAGSDRYSTAAAISAATFSPGVPAVYIAVGDNFPDALAGGPAAALAGGPILLTTKDVLPVATTSELARLDPGKIVVLGGTGVVSDGIVAQLAGFTTGTVTRLAGADRYSTAAAISAATFPAGTDVIYVAVGTNFPDALAGVSVAALDNAPILLVATDVLPGPTGAEIIRIDAAK